MKSVTIPADYFFKMAVKDYYNWRSALIREFIQNSVDAGSKQVNFTFDGEWLEIRDDGCGMSLDTIETALLTLGGSGKTGCSVGGIGKAKEILYFAWKNWEVWSKTYAITGSGPQYEIRDIEHQHGTTSRIRVGDRLGNVKLLIKDYLDICSINDRITVTYNDLALSETGIEYGDKIFNIDGLGDLYIVDGYRDTGKVIVQSHGLYMFSCYSVLDKCYVFNITLPSYDCLTSNRDSFVGEFQDKFTRMIGKVAIDSESTNLKKETVIQVSALRSANVVSDIKKQVGKDGFKKLAELAMANDKDITMLTPKEIAELLNGDYLTTESILGHNFQKIKTALVSSKTVNHTKLFDECLSWYNKVFPEGFIIVTDKAINSDLVWDMYQVDTLKMTWIWKIVVDEVANLSGIEKNYGFGLLMSSNPSILAECRDGYILYNPAPFIEMDWHECIVEFILSAAEELTHYIGHPYHNESFKCSLMQIIKAVVMERIVTDDIYRKNTKVTRKHGVKF
ncbi:ATP-binding protein [Desulfotignum phosphitoxidans]|uniref:GHKL-domain containing protein n=1 Tax=Desulfotignum phosphitoxidans DSM 13687 TaxID=1286635 RepID=S0FYZ5_9BACT|nr:ATP-binding protein [Desulfotignum phosphitoxidans]EMS78434.1 GHKL-domain containing protein [Desulfotignum phosphitoxidans DSM 13687]